MVIPDKQQKIKNWKFQIVGLYWSNNQMLCYELTKGVAKCCGTFFRQKLRAGRNQINKSQWNELKMCSVRLVFFYVSSYVFMLKKAKYFRYKKIHDFEWFYCKHEKKIHSNLVKFWEIWWTGLNSGEINAVQCSVHKN